MVSFPAASGKVCGAGATPDASAAGAVCAPITMANPVNDRTRATRNGLGLSMATMILNRTVLTSRQTVRIAWGDCDAAGIVYFPRYFEWFDAGTHALIDKAGLSFARMIEKHPGVAIPVVSTRATFILPS